MTEEKKRPISVQLLITFGFVLGPILTAIFIFTNENPVFTYISYGITAILFIAVIIKAYIDSKQLD